jgi:hypothetical protein
MKAYLGIEALESRIAPAVLVVNAHTATYLDGDGDHVTIKVSSGDLHHAVFTTAPAGTLGGEQLEMINLVSGFENANLSVKVSKAKTGDGAANVGAILASGENLGNVSVSGDLGQIEAGSNSLVKPAIKSLNVRSMGKFGLATQGGTGDLSSDINGALGSLRVANNVEGATINVFGGANAKLGSAFIGGSLIGSTGDNASGALLSSGDMGPVRIGKDLVGGPGFTSGAIESGGDLASVTIGGSIRGGSGFPFQGLSGCISSGGDMGLVKVGQDVIASSRALSGCISSHGKLAGVKIGGSLVGGDGENSGQITSAMAMGPIVIGHDIQGGTGFNSGDIISQSTIFSLTVGGSLKGGSTIESGLIRSASDLGPVKIGGDIHGTGLGSGSIDCGGNLASITVGGSVLGGTDSGSGAIFAGTIGNIKIGDNLQGGSGFNSGSIQASGDISKLIVGGSIEGGSANGSGSVHAGDVATVILGGSLVGGSVAGSDSLDSTGEIVGTHFGSVLIGGSIVSGTDSSTGSLTNNAGIRASENIGSLVVVGGIVGNESAGGNSPVIISAVGQAHPSATHDQAIGSIRIGGQVDHALILGGYSTSVDAADTRPAFLDNNAQIGSVKVGGDWIASSLVAGAIDTNNDGFGNADDSSGTGPVISKIAGIIISGKVVGTPQSGDHFGFESSQIGSFRSSGFVAPLTAATGQVFELSPATGDVTIREV